MRGLNSNKGFMTGRALKNYKEYMRRLELFALANGINIKYDENSSSAGVWLPAVRRIKLETELSNSVEVASLLHELGHSLDDLLSSPVKMSNELHAAYHTMYSDRKCTKKQKALVVACEKRAWNNGREIAARLKIPLGKWYSDVEQEFLSSYKE